MEFTITHTHTYTHTYTHTHTQITIPADVYTKIHLVNTSARIVVEMSYKYD